MSRSETIPGPSASSSITTAAPTPFSVIRRAASRSVWAGPTVNTTLDIPVRTSIGRVSSYETASADRLEL